MSYQAEARIVCRISGSASAVTLGNSRAPADTHAAFNVTSLTQRLFNVPPALLDQVPDNDKGACLAKAKAYLQSELPVSYSIDAAGGVPIPGHTWMDGRWTPTSAVHVAYAFPVMRNNERIEQECQCEDESGREQALVLSWWVVIQPR